MNIFYDFEIYGDPDLVGFNCDCYSDYIIKSPSSRSSRRSNRNKQLFIKTTQIIAGTCFVILLTSRGAKADEPQTWLEYGRTAFWGAKKVVPKTWLKYIFSDGIPLSHTHKTSFDGFLTSGLFNISSGAFSSVYTGMSVSKCVFGAYMAPDPMQKLAYSIGAACHTAACVSNLVCVYNFYSPLVRSPSTTVVTCIGLYAKYSAELMKVNSDCRLFYPLDPVLFAVCVNEGVKKLRCYP